MGNELHLFLLLTLIVSGGAESFLAEYFDPNLIISGFSNCYIDLVLLSEIQDFRTPPEIPVTVTYSEVVEQAQRNQAEAMRETILTALCFKKKVEHLRKINCLAVFIISNSQDRNLVTAVDTAQITLLTRYSWIFRCPDASLSLESEQLVKANYEKHTYVAVVQYHYHNPDSRQNSNILSDQRRQEQHDRQVRKLPIFFVNIGIGIGTTSKTISLAVELQSPCFFYISMELIRMENTRQVFDRAFSLGQRSKCSDIVWLIKESKSNATRPCVPFTDSSQFHEQQTAAIVSIVAEPFPNSTAFYVDQFWKLEGNCAELREKSRYQKPEITVSTGQELLLHYDYSAYLILYEEAYNFLTCDGVEDYLSFEAYASPFDQSSWIGILISSLISLLFLQAFIYFKRIPTRLIILLPSVFLEQPPQIPTKLLKHRSFKYLLISLLVAATVLTNSYKSVVTTGLTAPFSNNRVESFEKVVRLAYKILPPFDEFQVQVTRLIWERIANASVELQENLELGLTKQFLYSSHLSSTLLNDISLLPIRYREKRMQSQRMLNLIGVPENFPYVSFEMEISKCNKSVYVDYDYQLDKFRAEVLILTKGKLRSKMYKGKESFQKQSFSWLIEKMEWDRTEMVSKRWSALSHSGIFSHFNDIYRIEKVKSQMRIIEKLFGAEEEELVRPLTLKSTVISIFIVYFIFISFCTCILFAEKIHYFLHDYKCKLKTWMLQG